LHGAFWDDQYQTAFALGQTLRELTHSEEMKANVGGRVQVDNAHFSGRSKPEHAKDDRKDRRLSDQQTARRKPVFVARKRGGRTWSFTNAKESNGAAIVRSLVPMSSTVHADDASG
jgi:hypothetical protein